MQFIIQNLESNSYEPGVILNRVEHRISLFHLTVALLAIAFLVIALLASVLTP